MAESIYEKYGVERNRIPTDAELELVAHCFGVSRQEATSILSTRKLRTAARLASGGTVDDNEAYETGIKS